MKIISILSKFYPPVIDGVGDHSFILNELLTREGHQVNIIKESEHDFLFVEASIPIIINKIKSTSSSILILQYVGYSFSKKGAPFWLADFLKELKKELNIKVILIVHETWIRKTKKIKHEILRLLQKKALITITKHCDDVITSTNFYAEQLRPYHKKIIIAFTPSNFEFSILKETDFSPKSKKEVVKIACFGSRNPFFFLSVLTNLNPSEVNFEVNFIGKMSIQQLQLINNFINANPQFNINILGILEDQVLITTLFEQNLLFLFEAIVNGNEGGLSTKSGASACALHIGLPVMSIKGDFTSSDLFKDHHNFIAIPENNTQIAADILAKYLNNPSLLQEIGFNAKLLYTEHFSWELYLKKLKILIAE